MAVPQQADLGSLLLQRLAAIPCLVGAQGCALLNHPSHGNLGDHLIWIAQLHALEQILRIPVRYVASPDSYCPRALERSIGDGPIVLSGGGQLGDAWPQLETFIERVVNGHRCRSVVILSQSVHFQKPETLARAATVLQGHPDLTLVLRDRSSFDLAQRLFSGCRLLLAPDLAFCLPMEVLCLNGPSARFPQHPWLALHRGDRERPASGWLGALDASPQPVECCDWLPLERGWIWGDRRLPCSRVAATGVRELFQRRLLHPTTALMRHRWLGRLPLEWQRRARASSLHRLSLGMVHLAVHQLAGRQLVITDRLHAVILASLMGIPSLALDNRTGKVHSYLRTWGAWMPQSQAIAAEDLPQRLRQIAHHGPSAPVSPTT
ncbi:MAG: polysaccharide pyruvyl transferase family protein [Cyanobacteriota bacterium]|nr:polysaccharide pyruvyl transferase family protein [Cyanobacteriota bacterium]